MGGLRSRVFLQQARFRFYILLYSFVIDQKGVNTRSAATSFTSTAAHVAAEARYRPRAQQPHSRNGPTYEWQQRHEFALRYRRPRSAATANAGAGGAGWAYTTIPHGRCCTTRSHGKTSNNIGYRLASGTAATASARAARRAHGFHATHWWCACAKLGAGVPDASGGRRHVYA